MPTTRCEDYGERLSRVMPYGSSTASKAALYPPEEPTAIECARGCRVWDVDGREFIDFRNGLGPISLGYCYPAVDEAIREQIARGIVFSHPHRLECEVAELLAGIIPCAGQVRFLKTGGEAMAACIRLARAFTGREHVVQIGYNGWINSLAAGGQYRPGVAAESIPAGVPAGLAAVHHAASWNDLDGVRRLFDLLPGQIAAVCVAASYAEMGAGKTFYPALRDLATRHGSLLIFDEIVTGFRLALAGVQQYFGVMPDLAVFAKGVANGMPLSLYCGRREIMRLCDRGGRTSISSTYGGECLSLAAAKAVIGIYQGQDVVGHLWRQGEAMWGGLGRLFQRHGVPLTLQGLWPCPQFVAAAGTPADLLPRFFRAACRHGVTLYTVPYVNFSHQDGDVAEALARLEKALADL
jgi:glutamate-1-semialdehyde 2,1-aminomutase